MNKMYVYLKEHAYVSENKHSNYQFELSEERAKCIANKYNSLTDKLQEKNKQLQERIEYLERSNNRREITIFEQNQKIIDLEDNWDMLKDFIDTLWLDNKGIVTKIKDKIKFIEQGSDSNENN